MSSNFIYRFLAIFFILCCLSAASLADDKLALQWSYKADGKILALATGDVNDDGVPEIVAVSAKKVFILDSKGSLIKYYPVKFSPSAVYLADIDNDGRNEILLGSGWLNTTDVHSSRFDFTDLNNIKEVPEYLYRTLRSQGDVYLIRWNSTSPVKLLSAGHYVRSIASDDVDGDGNKEIVIGSGGTDIDYVELVTQETDPVTGNLTYIRNKTERYSNNGSVMVFFQNGSLKSYYPASTTVFYVGTALFREGESTEILAGSDRVLFLTENLSFISSSEPSQKNSSIIDMFTEDVNQNGVNELLYAYIGPAVSGIYLVKRDGSTIWEYRLPSKNLVGLFPANLDVSGNEKIVVSSDKALYVLNNEGRLEWSNLFQNDVSDIKVTDLENDSYLDFITSSADSINVYGLNPAFVKSLLAQKYYDQAKVNYEIADYQGAVSNVSSAKSLYLELSDSEGVARCDALTGKINQELKNTKKESADTLYSQGRSEYYFGNYASAKEYIQKAREIYSQIGDAEGVSKSDQALRDMESESIPGGTTTTQASPVTVTTTTLPGKTVEVPPVIFALLAIIVIALIIFALKMIRKNSKGGPDDKDGPQSGSANASHDEDLKKT